MPEIFGNDNLETLILSFENFIKGTYFTCPEAGTANSITVYVYNNYFLSRTGNVKCALYKKSDRSFVAATEERNITLSGRSGAWETFNFSNSPELENIDYYIVAWTDQTNFYLKYKTLTNRGCTDPETYNSWSDPVDCKLPDYYYYSIYCTYTPGAPPGTNMKINIGDTLKDVDSLKIKIGGVWKDVNAVKQNIGGVWKDVFS